MDISTDKFKNYIKTKVPLSSIILRNKNSNSAFDIKCIKMKELIAENDADVPEKIVVELNTDVIKRKKVIKKA
jgi:hypothetical protein